MGESLTYILCERAVCSWVQRLSMQNCIASAHVFGMFHDHSDIFFIPNMHEAASCQLVFPKHLKEHLDGGLIDDACDFGDPLPRVLQNRLVLRTPNLYYS